MAETSSGAMGWLRERGLRVVIGLAVVGAVAFLVRFVLANRGDQNKPRKVMQYTMVRVQPTPPPRPPPKPIQPPKPIEPQMQRVDLKPQDFAPPEAARQAAAEPPSGGGRLSLAAEGSGPGDQFNLVGNPGGRGILTGGGLGDGSGDGEGLGGGGGSAKFGWYYTRLASEIEDAFRKNKHLNFAETRVELRVWSDASGRISRIELIHSTGDAELDDAIRSVTGMRLKEPPPPEIPMPMLARLTARRPQ